MSKWCNYYNCWCSDLEEIIDTEYIECEQGCRNCDEMEVIEYDRQRNRGSIS